MGWLQGLRYQNGKQLKDAISPIQKVLDSKSGLSSTEHVEYQLDQKAAELHEGGANKFTSEQQQRNSLEISIEDCERSLCDEDVLDKDLPFIPREEVMSKRIEARIQESKKDIPERNGLWIVVDNIVYDCFEFVTEHPGGQQVIRSFVGEDCSWQFWRFHGQEEMLRYGLALRVGRTEGVPNRFKEPPRYVGLARIGHDEW